MLRDRYLQTKIPSIANTASLASLLEITEQELFYIADNVTEFYKPGAVKRKKNGEPRPTHDAKPVLKQIHARIKNRILKQAIYPYYMLGGISDPENPRSCKAHAQIHAGKKILMSEDIANFYPSTSYEVVEKVWKYYFKFGETVSQLLTKLTTFNCELPQGWKTSGYIANLTLLSKEAELVKTFEDKGLSYSRFIDDITVSSPYFLTSEDKQFIVSNIYTMLFSCGYKPKRTKHEIVSREAPMLVTSLNVNTKKPTVPSSLRRNIRTMVHQLECEYSARGRTFQFYKQWLSVYGKVNRVKSFHMSEGSKLQDRMRRIKPPKNFFKEEGNCIISKYITLTPPCVFDYNQCLLITLCYSPLIYLSPSWLKPVHAREPELQKSVDTAHGATRWNEKLGQRHGEGFPLPLHRYQDCVPVDQPSSSQRDTT
jgi:hypothetical protein